MHVIARVLAVAYVVLAVFAGAVLAQMVSNNVNVSYVQAEYGRADQPYVRVESVWLNWSGNLSQDAWILVNFSVANPSGVMLEIVGVNYDLYMDNTTDAFPWYDPQGLDRTHLTTKELSLPRGLGSRIPGGQTRTVSSENLIRATDPSSMRILNQPDTSGRFHPVVYGPWLTYDFPDFPVDRQPVFVPTYYEEEGVVPSG